ncbi:hypothetical protein O0I10_003794 [Lichtheimia ornata]|uniref:Transcription elongation regulator 1 n=1 Tax=Lichtheimia ornata TaxID=688661 RepID=A0AAD7Y2D6_9FUNG|nr:uncharacterized protein O0I10_003794 [Lichtheimia ornata]KAJ8660337.1 hypothetical protein O0I10_003794 [Lichtheimia ornata]
MNSNGQPPPPASMPFQGQPGAPRPPPPFMPGPPLPPNWQMTMTPQGEVYYYNAVTGVTSWTRPIDPVLTAPATQQTPDQASNATDSKKKQKKTKKPIPGTEWLLVRTSDGLEFYFDKANKKSVWEMPEELKEPIEKLKEQERVEEEESRKRKLQEQEAEENDDSKRPKTDQEEQEPEETTEMTEEDIMWQLQNMDPEEMEAMGINVEGDNKEPTPSEEEQQQQPPAPQNDTAAQAQEAPSSSAQPIESSTGPQISDEEKIELFTQMLTEKNLDPFSTWEKELPKFINDERYALLPHGKRKNLFNNYCRVLAEEQKAKRPQKKSPEEEFMSLLTQEATTKMYWDDFRRKAKNDPRFKAIRESKTREAMFRDYVKKLRKEKESGGSSRQREAAYNELLRETKDIQPGMRWRDAKLILEKDNRYHAIESKRLREDLFRDYLEELEDSRGR